MGGFPAENGRAVAVVATSTGHGRPLQPDISDRFNRPPVAGETRPDLLGHDTRLPPTPLAGEGGNKALAGGSEGAGGRRCSSRW